METIEEIFTDQIDDPANPMRSEQDRAALFELADNIKQNGLINPITVRPIHSGDSRVCTPNLSPDGLCHLEKHIRYEVVAGHRRLSACKIAGLIKIQCVVRELNDGQTFAVMAAENLERADIDPVDEANFISKYIALTKITIPEVAKILRRSVSYVETRLAVGFMPDYMKEYIKCGKLKLGVALALVQIGSEQTRRVWVEMAVRDGVTVAQAEHWLHGWRLDQLPGGTMSEVPPGDFSADAPHILMFRCAIDDHEYDARLFKTRLIYEGNLAIFDSIAFEMRKPPSEIITPPAENL